MKAYKTRMMHYILPALCLCLLFPFPAAGEALSGFCKNGQEIATDKLPLTIKSTLHHYGVEMAVPPKIGSR